MIPASNAKFAGVWHLVGEEARDATGRTVPIPYAARGGRIGYITYDPLGHVGVVLAWVEQPTVSRHSLTAEQAALALERYNSYWGGYTVDEGVVTHRVHGCVLPRFTGVSMEREFTLTAKRLTLRPPPAADGEQHTLAWERLRDLPNLTPTQRRLIGFWKLVSFERRRADGERLPVDPGETGLIVYTASGHVIVHLMQAHRWRNVGATPTPAETLATYRSYVSYFGTYSVDEAGGFVVHHLEGSFNTAPPGTNFKRRYAFDGRRLTLEGLAAPDAEGRDVHATLVWERLSD
jgi:hypothetical protein